MKGTTHGSFPFLFSLFVGEQKRNAEGVVPYEEDSLLEGRFDSRGTGFPSPAIVSGGLFCKNSLNFAIL